MGRACSDMPVLVVEDEHLFRVAVTGMLREDGHDVLEFAEPAHLPSLLTLGRVDLLLCDYELPGENGLALADRFHVTHAARPIILVTGYRTHRLDTEAARRPFVHLVEKPIRYDELHALMHQLVIASSPGA
jgi:DNA-binding NtrC family response regulator